MYHTLLPFLFFVCNFAVSLVTPSSVVGALLYYNVFRSTTHPVSSNDGMRPDHRSETLERHTNHESTESPGSHPVTPRLRDLWLSTSSIDYPTSFRSYSTFVFFQWKGGRIKEVIEGDVLDWPSVNYSHEPFVKVVTCRLTCSTWTRLFAPLESVLR